jgi:hypothetical protein
MEYKLEEGTNSFPGIGKLFSLRLVLGVCHIGLNGVCERSEFIRLDREIERLRESGKLKVES